MTEDDSPRTPKQIARDALKAAREEGIVRDLTEPVVLKSPDGTRELILDEGPSGVPTITIRTFSKQIAFRLTEDQREILGSALHEPADRPA